MVSFFRYSLTVSLPRTFARYVLRSNGIAFFCLMSRTPHLGGIFDMDLLFSFCSVGHLSRFNLAQRLRRSQQREPAHLRVMSLQGYEASVWRHAAQRAPMKTVA